ncbi:PREDICTED: double-stranded RNA-binding protein 1 [Tarenaya hassleriana]|uniref:double-stranded RNA-binding protein 1 n=1 Tax=Tarenaya hassleriana TaxID=28532 RepID=UPI00053C6499|nr:PREDICTED: double-stranded RNA-binding protein 1 [Tarenaya hassleriana]
MPTNDPSSGVSNCYVFKSRLQEYAQKFKLPTPVYETIKEGPSHEPCFRSAVIVDGIRYDSLPGFFNRKAAEQSAAEVALSELSKSSELSECVSQPVHETGLCKNLLQEFAQKMNYAIPLYQCQKNEASGGTPFTCTVEIGGIKYIGAAARTKKEAELSAAKTALLAIQIDSNINLGDTQLTVRPFRKRTAEQATPVKETVSAPKPKKGRYKNKFRKPKNRSVCNKSSGNDLNQREAAATEGTDNCQTNLSVALNSSRESIETPSNVGVSTCVDGFKDSFGSVEA